MARAVAGAVCVVLVFCMVVPSLATVYTVGESSGWTMGADYSTWTSGKTFAVGDSLGKSSVPFLHIFREIVCYALGSPY